MESEEFNVVNRFFQKGMSNFSGRIVSLRRIQNIEILRWYQMTYVNVLTEKFYKFEKRIEKRLFCSLNFYDLNDIIKNSIDPRAITQDEKTFNEYGLGIYLSKLSITSYLKSSNKTLFLTRAIVGKEVLKGKKELRRPPYIVKTINIADSVHGDFGKDKIFVIFDKNQILPEYLIEFDLDESKVRKIRGSGEVDQSNSALSNSSYRIDNAANNGE